MAESAAKIRKTFNYLLRGLIIVVTYGFIYRQVFIHRKWHDFSSIFDRFLEKDNAWLFIALILFMMLVNWGIESLKWQLLITKIEKLSYFKAFQAVLAGASVSFFMPNRTGDYLGRVFILEKGNHVEGIFSTLVGSFAQTLITFCIGLFCLLTFVDHYLRVPYEIGEYVFTSLILIVPCVVFALLLIYFNIGLISDFIGKYLPAKWKKFIGYSQVFGRYSWKELLRVILLSLLRYLVFTAQFLIVMKLFGARIPIVEGLILIPVVYLIMALVPSVALIELGIRGSVAIFVMGLYYKKFGAANSSYEMIVLAATSVIWFINLVIPALLGTFFVFRLKFFRK